MQFRALALGLTVVAGCSPAVNSTTAPPVAPADATSPPSVAPPLPGAPPAAPGAVNPAETTSSALPADKRITDEIRQKIHSDAVMSVGARSVQIITAGGKVSLRGTVESQAEKEKVEALAADVVGKDNVTSDLVWKEGE